MKAVCPDVSQNLATLDTCHVMFLDVATTMLSKIVFSVCFYFPNFPPPPHLFCVGVLCSCTPCIGANQSQLQFNYYQAHGKFNWTNSEAQSAVKTTLYCPPPIPFTGQRAYLVG